MKETDAFILQGRIKLIKTDSKDIHNFMNNFYFK